MKKGDSSLLRPRSSSKGYTYSIFFKAMQHVKCCSPCVPFFDLLLFVSQFKGVAEELLTLFISTCISGHCSLPHCLMILKKEKKNIHHEILRECGAEEEAMRERGERFLRCRLTMTTTSMILLSEFLRLLDIILMHSILN
jgi:hypothetical protein